MADGVITPDAAETMPAATDIETAQPICRCGTTERHPADEHRCRNGHALPGNAFALKDGVRRFETRGNLDAEQQAARRTFLEGLIADKGGEPELTTIERAVYRRASELDTIASLVVADIARRGLFTPKGRVRGSLDKYLAVLSAFDKYAGRIGFERRPKALQSLADYLTSHAPERETHE